MASTLKKLAIGALALVGLSVVALLLAPAFIDVNAYRAEVAAEVARATGREVSMSGPLSLRLLPLPRVKAEDVKVANLPGSKNPDMVQVKAVTVTPSLWALLRGELAVSEVVLDEPKIVLEINAEGTPNWEFAPSVAEARPAAAQSSAPRPLSVGRMTIDNGTVIFSDSRAGLSVAAEKAHFTASVASMEGPLSLSGSATVNGSPLKVDLALGPRAPGGHTAGVTLEAGGGKLVFNGTLSELGPQARMAGKVVASADNLVGFVDTLVQMTGRPPPPLPLLLGGKFRFEGRIEASQTAFSCQDFTLALADDAGTGSVDLKLAPVVVLRARFAARRLDLDKWLAGLTVPDEVAAPAPTTPFDAPPQAVTPARANPLMAIDAQVALEVGELVYNKQPMRELALELETRGGAVAVPRFHAVLPGDLTIRARSTMSQDAAAPRVSGEFDLQGSRLRETLSWLGADVSTIPPHRLQTVTMKGRLTSSDGNAEVRDAVFRLDQLEARGGIVVSFSVPLSAVMTLDFDTLDIDSYVPRQAPSFAPGATSGIPVLALLGPSVGLKVRIAKVLYRGDRMASVEFDVARDRGTLRLNDLRVADLAGARLAVRGAVAGYWENHPKADLVFSFDAPDMGRVLHLAGVEQPGLGPVKASGGIAGTYDALVLREVSLSAMGLTGRATGTLRLPGAAEGKLRSAAYQGNIALNGHGMQASIDATLGDRPNVMADLRADVLDLQALRGAARAAPAPDSQPIDTAPLRSFDGSFHVAAGTLLAPPLRIANADIAASLKGGVFTLSHFTGGLLGGTLELAGTVDGSQPALAFDFHGHADGLPVGDMLRAATGTNVFGSVLNVAIDGRLSANDIVLRGRGTTNGELQRSLAGGARLSGHVRASADRFLQIVGSAATGAVGGAIDLTLGNLMSLAGDKGGVGLGNLLNAISLVLHRYVNHDNAVAGQLQIAGGMLTAQGLTVQGSSCTANVASETSLASATTQTRIAFVIAEDPSAPYLVTTASGPLSTLSFSATRGSAKDPPGLAKLVPDLGSMLPKDPAAMVPHISVPHIPLPAIPNPFGR